MRDSADNQNNQTTGNDARSAPRVPVNLTVQLIGIGDKEAILVNVGRGGLFVGTDTPAEIGSLIHLQFRMLKTRVCQAVGTVVWQRPTNDEQRSGFGVAFVDTNKNMDSFVRNVSSLPERLRMIYLADVMDPRIELGLSSANTVADAALTDEVA